MRKLLTWIVVTLGIAALVRKLRQRGGTSGSSAHTGDPVAGDPVSGRADPAGADPAGADPAGTDPAGELRRKLADSREGDETSATLTPKPNVDDRRSEVHDQGRAAIDEMQRSTED